MVVIGGGPAGLTAAHRLVSAGDRVVVVEADDVVGGISRTVDRDGWRFDIGGHRFFTKVKPVEEFWHEILPEGDFLLRPRMSRIFYRGKFYDYPIKLGNALSNLGIIEAIRCGLSFLWVRIHPPKDRSNARGLHRLQLRLAPVPPLLQDLQREGLGRSPRRSSPRIGVPSGSRACRSGTRCGSRSALR